MEGQVWYIVNGYVRRGKTCDEMLRSSHHDGLPLFRSSDHDAAPAEDKLHHKR